MRDVSAASSASKQKRARPSNDADARGAAGKASRKCSSLALDDANQHETLWNCEHSVPEDEWRTLFSRAGLQAKIRSTSLECVQSEIIRWGAISDLREAFWSACEKKGFSRKMLPAGAWEKWHSTLITCARTSDPLLPDKCGDVDTRAKMKYALVSELTKAGMPDLEAKDFADEAHELAASAARNLAACLRNDGPPMAATTEVTDPTADHDITVALGQPEEGGTKRVIFRSHTGPELKINTSHYAKLKHLWQLNREHRRELQGVKKTKAVQQPPQSGGAAVWIDADLAEFHRRAYALLLRYKATTAGGRGGGFHAALGGPVFDCLLQDFGAGMECFASPFNCRYRNYCSAFVDTDGPFGSLGSFFNLRPKSGSFQANPPFVEEVMEGMARRMHDLLGAAQQSGECLSFVVIVGANSESRKGKAHAQLSTSRFLRATLSIPLAQHGYLPGLQHLTGEPTRLSTCDTAVFFLQTDAGAERWAATEERLGRLTEAFRATRPAKLTKTPKWIRAAGEARRAARGKGSGRPRG